VDYRILQPRIPVVTADEVSEALPGHPCFRLSARNVSPRKRPGGNRLIQSIDAQSVVRAGPAKSIALGRIIGDINAAACIDQPTPSIHGEPYAECIGVPMPSAAHALRAGIHYQRLWVGF